MNIKIIIIAFILGSDTLVACFLYCLSPRAVTGCDSSINWEFLFPSVLPIAYASSFRVLLLQL